MAVPFLCRRVMSVVCSQGPDKSKASCCKPIEVACGGVCCLVWNKRAGVTAAGGECDSRSTATAGRGSADAVHKYQQIGVRPPK